MKSGTRCYKYDELTIELLRQFAEGSESLEQLLINCYNHQIETRACCASHEKDETSDLVIHNAYILFIVKEKQYPLMEYIINKMSYNHRFVKLTKFEIEMYENEMKFAIQLDPNSNYLAEEFFSYINSLVTSYINSPLKRDGIYSHIFEAYNELYKNELISEIIINNNSLEGFLRKFCSTL